MGADGTSHLCPLIKAGKHSQEASWLLVTAVVKGQERVTRFTCSSGASLNCLLIGRRAVFAAL